MNRSLAHLCYPLSCCPPAPATPRAHAHTPDTSRGLTSPQRAPLDPPGLHLKVVLGHRWHATQRAHHAEHPQTQTHTHEHSPILDDR